MASAPSAPLTPPPVPPPVRCDLPGSAPNPLGAIAREFWDEPDFVRLWFGESDLVTPAPIRAAAIAALEAGDTFYGPARGRPALRAAIDAFHGTMLGVRPGAERITVPGSAMLCVVLALQCLLRSGDEVAIITPVWPNIFLAVEAAGGTPRFARLAETGPPEARRWALDLDVLAAVCGPRTRAVFVATPSNPTGATLSRDELAALLTFCRDRGLALISDEVYGPLWFEGRAAPSVLQLAGPDDAVFAINGFSKPWAMTGWRMGWLVHPLSLAERMMTLSAVLNTGTPGFLQAAGEAALAPDGLTAIAAVRARSVAGREAIAGLVSRHSALSWVPPDGAFYAWLAVKGVGDSMDFARRLAREARVGVAPGIAFGPADDANNANRIRLCFAQSPETLDRAIKRLDRFFGTFGPG